MARSLSKVRVLLVHDWLYTWAGAERCLEEMVALMPHADVVAGFVTPEARASHEIARHAKATWVGAIPGAHRNHRWFLPLHALAFSVLDTRRYDLVVSLSHAFAKSVRVRGGGARHVCYCFSPPRYLWDLKDLYDDFASPIQRFVLRSAAPVMRSLDRLGAQGVHRFVSVSRHVAGRVRRCYSRESDVVYPPVRLKNGAADGARNGGAPFLLTLGRLVPYKRVDLAIRAAEQLQMRLVVAGDGPERARLEGLAGKYTEFRGHVSEAAAAELLSTCAAFLFCAEDDFGIAPIEANAHGAPVVALRRGAALETLEEGATAVFFDRPDVDSLARAIEWCLARRWDDRALRQNAERFSPERFRTGMRSALESALSVE